MRHKIQYNNLPENPEKHKKEFVEKMYAKQRGLRARRRLKEHLAEKQNYRKPVRISENRNFREKTINNKELFAEIRSIDGKLDLKRFIENNYDLNVGTNNLEKALIESIKLFNLFLQKVKRYL